ncbi:MAG: hypothetical protein QM756_46270 [Polyangiaceae bacterium]
MRAKVAGASAPPTSVLAQGSAPLTALLPSWTGVDAISGCRGWMISGSS